jgi:hypothetical protein
MIFQKAADLFGVVSIFRETFLYMQMRSKLKSLFLFALVYYKVGYDGVS